jgi:hypothetical protein
LQGIDFQPDEPPIWMQEALLIEHLSGSLAAKHWLGPLLVKIAYADFDPFRQRRVEAAFSEWLARSFLCPA